MVLLTIVLPAFLIFASGYVLKRLFPLDIKTLSTIAFYCFLPALVFQTMYEADIKKELGTILLFEVLLVASLIVLIKIYTWVAKESRSRESSLILGSVFINSGNYGSPIILFAFGEKGFHLAVF